MSGPLKPADPCNRSTGRWRLVAGTAVLTVVVLLILMAWLWAKLQREKALVEIEQGMARERARIADENQGSDHLRVFPPFKGVVFAAKVPAAKHKEWQLSVSTPKQEYHVGEPIPLKVTFRNQSSKTLGLPQLEMNGVPFAKLDPVITSPSGDTNAMERLMHDMMSMRPTLFRVPLLPKAAWSYEWADLHDWASMLRKPGKYTVLVEYLEGKESTGFKDDVRFPTWHGTLVSNTLAITVKK